MAIIRRNLETLKRSQPAFDRARIEGASDADIARFEEADQRDAAAFVSPRAVRNALNMTQSEFASALRVPLATLQNWEQGRVVPDPAARALLTIVSKDAKAAFKALETEAAR